MMIPVFLHMFVLSKSTQHHIPDGENH